MLKVFRFLLWWYAIGGAFAGIASLLLGFGVVFALAALTFSASAWWAVLSRSPIATLVCGVAGVLPILSTMTLLEPGMDRTAMLGPGLVSGTLWFVICAVMARRIAGAASCAASAGRA